MATGTLTAAAQSVSWPAGGPLLEVVFTGTFAGVEIVSQISADGTNWCNFPGLYPNAGGPPVATVDLAAGTGSNVQGYLVQNIPPGCQFRIYCNAITSGTVNVNISGGSGTGTPTMTSLNAVTGTGAGTSFGLGSARSNFSVQLVIGGTGSLSALSVTLQGSLDGTNWTNIGAAITSTSTSLTLFTGAAVNFVRLNVGTFTVGSGSPTVTGNIAAA